jgi:Fe-S-cluster-containing hydrogenase component 2
MLEVLKERCPQNHNCPAVRVCPVDALKQNGFSAPMVDEDACIMCGKCVKFCPMNAIVLDKEK